MSYMRLRQGAWITHLGQRCMFERRQDHLTEWRSTNGTFEHFVFTDTEIQRGINAGNMQFYDGFGRPPREVRNVSKVHGARGPTVDDREEARRKLCYVLRAHELGCLNSDAGPHLWLKAIDDVFSAHGPQWKRLRGARKGEPTQKPSFKSLRRWAAEAGPKPKMEKLISAHRHKGNYNDRIRVEVREIIDELVKSRWMARPPITIETLRDLVNGRIGELNTGLPPGATAFRLAGLTAIQSSIDAMPRNDVMRARHGDMAAFLKFGSAEAQADPTAPLDRVELDSTPADLFVICSRTGLPLGRPTIVICVDRCTRMVLGWFVTFEKPSVLALMQCLRNSILTKDYIAEMNEEHGWNIRHECVTFGIPASLVIDRALENVADHVMKLAQRVGINQIHLMGGRKPWLKGCVESTIGTMSERLLHPSKGTTFHNTLVRLGYDPEKDAVCTVDDLDWGLHKYFIDIYPREQRRSINNRRAVDLWNELTRKYPVDSISSIDDVSHLFGRTDTAVPGRHGINANSMQYFSRELLEVQRTSRFKRALEKQGGRIEYHIDPADIARIYVELPHEERTIVVPVAPKWREYATGLSLFAHRKIRAYTNETARTANDADQLLACKLELLDIMRGQALRRNGGIAARQTLARFEGVARTARSGDDAGTSVPGSPAHTYASRTIGRVRTPSNDDEGSPSRPTPHETAAAAPPPPLPRPDQSDATVPHSPAAPARAKKGYRP
ncbi:hypothetical protein LPN01_15235 [Sphingomonas sp. A2-49]|uniref:hypothetical protein n=1 Tax=Sphingomonas sp. A2-49 TaxID=1391375 RepID=UPI0021D08EEC|nr:hypothetical protein [Sphingomonas sp. A2-49]MCU6455434.1 hypothetical protein [Sphingomonas sp. A2-49]